MLPGQSIFMGGVHVFVFRIIVLAGCGRLLLTKLTSGGQSVFTDGFTSLDSAFLWCMLVQAMAVVLLFRDGSALINQFGFLWDQLGGYFFVRFLINDEQDILRTIKTLAMVAVILAVCMVRERLTMQNVFAYVGGAADLSIRDGKVRSQGPFEHALTAGAFGATLLPLFFFLWKNGSAKFHAGLALVSSAVITWAANTSTSLLTFGAGAFAIAFWPLRKSMRRVRWGIVFGLLALQCVMKSPVWFVMARIDLTGGSSGYHRAELVDAFVKNLFDWWLIGVKETGSWGWGVWDAQNQFVNVGETGGLIALILFIALVSRSFTRIGNARKNVEGELPQEWFLWCLGAALFAHIVGFFGVNYFDQSKVAWFALLAMIAAGTAPLLQKTTKPETQLVSRFAKIKLAPSAAGAGNTAAPDSNYRPQRPFERAPVTSKR
jgi:hypothetical protein